jgi:aspartyl-tRNA(Asn)/glutamyl-tRNA(Gln) amidotransferase subunit C
MEMNQDTIHALTALSRIGCTEEEQEALLKDIQKILAYIEQLNEVDVSNVLPCNQVISDQFNVFREDVVGQTLSSALFLELAPSKTGGFIRVPKVLSS